MKIRKIPLLILLALLFSVIPMQAYADNARISFSDPTATVGKTFTIKMTVAENIAALDVYAQYDSSMIQYVSASGGVGNLSVSGGGGSVHIMDYYSSGEGKFSATLTFKALKAGATSLSVSKIDISDGSGDQMNASAAKASITLKEPETASDNNQLSALQVSPGRLSPSFSASTQSYRMTVDSNVTKIIVTAKAADTKATVSVSGNNNLKVGNNTVTVSVKAENGSLKKYTIVVTRKDPGNTPATEPSSTETDSPWVVAGTSRVEILEPKAEDKPTGFTETVDDDLKVPVFNRDKLLPLIYGKKDGEEVGYWYYDRDNEALYPYASLKAGVTNLRYAATKESLLPVEDYLRESGEVMGISLQVYKEAGKENPTCYLVPVLHTNGSILLYTYDTQDVTLQRYGVSGRQNEDTERLLAELQVQYDAVKKENDSLQTFYDSFGEEAENLKAERDALDDQLQAQKQLTEKTAKEVRRHDINTYIALGLLACESIAFVIILSVRKGRH